MVLDEQLDETMDSSTSMSDSDEETQEIELPLKQLPQRSTRGHRYSALSGIDAEADEEFWGQEAWNVDDIDQDYSTEEGRSLIIVRWSFLALLYSNSWCSD